MRLCILFMLLKCFIMVFVDLLFFDGFTVLRWSWGFMLIRPFFLELLLEIFNFSAFI